MAEKILTLHPQGKKGVNIDLGKYTMMKEAILETITEHGTMTYKELDRVLNMELNGRFDGSISWYCVSVKLDLEARGIIERLPKTSPHQIRLANTQQD